MAFDEVDFPLSIAKGSSGGPTFKTNVVEVDNGNEGRSADWTQGRIVYDAAYGVRSITDIATLLAFFHACKGKARGFRFKDYTDFTSASDGISVENATDQIIGFGNSSATQFQLVKRYTSGLLTHIRDITKPVSGTVKVAIDGTELDEGTVDPVFISRATVATYFDSTGTLQEAAINTLRYGYNPATLVYLGAIIETPNTYNYVHDNTFSTPVIGIIGSGGALPSGWELSIDSGLTCEIIGMSTENGIHYMDIKFSGTTTATQNNILRMNNYAQIRTYYYQQYNISAFLKLTAGSLSNLTSLKLGMEDMFTSTIEASADLKGEITSAALRTQRKEQYKDLTSWGNTYVMPNIIFAVNSGVTVDFTLRIGLPQIEFNADDSTTVATTPIRTVGTTGYRAADVTTIPTGPKKFTVDNLTGLVTISSPPATDEVVTAGYEFNVPVRFDTDSLTISLTHIQKGQFSIPLIEVRV